jgi:hypothetical protein
METVSFPTLNPAALTWSADHPGVQMWTKVASVYRNLVQESATQLWLSSAQIIPEHTLKAFADASQSCFDALTKNAAAVQQQALVKMIGANQQAATIVGNEVSDAVLSSMKLPE